MEYLAQSLARYLNSLNGMMRLEDIYYYDFDEAALPVNINFTHINNSYRRNLELKNQLHIHWRNGNFETKSNIIKYYIKEWGQIKGNSIQTLDQYCEESDEQLIARNINRVFSWSKALVIHNPTRFFIYDSRVMISINCLQILTNTPIKYKFYMPTPNGKPNRPIRVLKNLLEDNGFEYTNWRNLETEGHYNSYLRLLDLIQSESDIDKPLIEMTLFQLADILSCQVLNNQ
jgi:hypothetical protein